MICSIVTPQKILAPLIDKYEKSKSFTGSNKVNQSFSVRVADLFPNYTDEAEIDWFHVVNETLCDLEKKGFVRVDWQKNGVAKLVLLEVEAIEQIYLFLKRTPKRDVVEDLRVILCQYLHSNSILSAYCGRQLARLEANKSVEYFDGDFVKYRSVLEAIANILAVETETFERDFSIRVFSDSKVFGGIKGTVEAILRKYGDFPESGTLLADLNIIKNPGHVFFKGQARISIEGQIIDLSILNGDIAFSSVMLNSIDYVEVLGNSVITIENLTTFNSFCCKNSFAIYLGGYHNEVRRSFIKKVYAQNAGKSYFHFGDIDAGGFYILEHLRKRTGISFAPYCMNVQALSEHMQYAKRLEKNDRKRLLSLLGSEFDDTIKFMLEHDCKLEQEAIDLSKASL